MATVTIQPDLYVQATNRTVTEINPTTKYTSGLDYNPQYYIFVRFPLDTTQEYSHAYITTTASEKTPSWTVSPPSTGGIYVAQERTKSNNNPIYNIGDNVTLDSLFTNLDFWNHYGEHTLKGNPGRCASGYLWIALKGTPNSLTTFTDLTLTLTYTTVAAPALVLLPSSGYIQHNSAQMFKLSESAADTTLLPFTAVSGVLYYKETSATTYNQIAFTGDSVTLPANTLSGNKTYTMYADYVTADGQNATTGTREYTTADGTGTTTGQTPNNSIEYGNVTFTWTYRNSTGTAQYAYDLDLSDDGETYTTVLSHVVTSATTATYNVSTAGGKYWRVRGYNQNDVAGSYSTPLYFVNNIPPSPPVITNITGAGRLTVTWAADNQSAYEVEVYNGDTRVYDSTVVYTADTTHLINEYLPNGTYTIKVKTINIYGHTSDYAMTVYTVSNVGSLSVSGTYENGTATLSYPDGNYAKYYIQRDGVTIAKTTEKTYTDMYMNGTATYTVIAVNSDDSYAIGTATVSGTVPFTRFVDLDGNVYDISKRWQQRIGVQVSNEAEYDTALYLGAKRPAHTFGTGRIRRYAIAFTYEGDYTVFMGKVLRYMDIYGNADYVVVPNINEVEARYGNELTASLEVTDYNEGITYDL